MFRSRIYYLQTERIFPDGITKAEEKLFLDLGEASGARVTKLHVGATLSSQQVGGFFWAGTAQCGAVVFVVGWEDLKIDKARLGSLL